MSFKPSTSPAIRLVVKRGLSSQLKPNTLIEGEVGFNTDTSELVVGTDTEKGWKVVSSVVSVPASDIPGYEQLMAKLEDGTFLPLGIKRETQKEIP